MANGKHYRVNKDSKIAKVIAKVAESFEKVVAGEIVPAANFNGMTPDAFTGL